jgi:hypothetical protein
VVQQPFKIDRKEKEGLDLEVKNETIKEEIEEAAQILMRG